MWFRLALLSAAAALLLGGASQPASPGIALAFYNIRSGFGVPPLRGHPEPFANVPNCTDRSKPLNAWGAGVVPQTLTSALSAPNVIALGLAEAWKASCASPEHVRETLGWKAASDVHNGVGLVAHYGFSDQQWQQLDTSRNKNPKDTAWVLRAAICTSARCDRKLVTYTAHWYATGPDQRETYAGQARQTVDFMRSTSGGQPHVLIGDLNVWTASGPVCRQTPNGDAAIAVLEGAGYIDAWPAVHGTHEGYTGMVNRVRCGEPEGYAWKRIDYAWSSPGLRPLDMTRFGVVRAGDAAPSDHYGILATYP
jgi:exonuclease III